MLGVLTLSRALSGRDTKNRLATIFVSRPRRQSLRMHVRPLNWSGELGGTCNTFHYVGWVFSMGQYYLDYDIARKINNVWEYMTDSLLN